MLRKYQAGLLLFVFVLPGCAGMPLTSMFKLKGVDPMVVDPAQIRIAIRADEHISIPDGAAHIALKFDADDDGLHIDDKYVIEIIRNPILTPELIDGKKTGELVTVLQLTESDALKMRQAQTIIKPYSEGRGRGTLSFGVDIRGVCVQRPVPRDEALVDIYIKTSDYDDFFVLTQNMDLSDDIQREEMACKTPPLL